MRHIDASEIVLPASSFLLGMFFAYVYRQKRQPYLLVWSAGLMVISFLLLGALPGAWGVSSRWFQALNAWLVTVAALIFYCAARLYSRQRTAIWAVIGAGGVAAAWSFAYAYGYVGVPVLLGGGLAFFAVGWTFWQEGQKQESRAEVLLALTFGAGGLSLCMAVILQPRIAALSGMRLGQLTFLPLLFGGVLMMMAVYEEERRRVERNMLALSNLNLAASGFTGGDIQKMLGQALDRVLKVARIPAGALCMSYGESQGPSSVVATGLGEEFCSAIQEFRLDEYVISLVARLGGLVVMRDLASDATWEASRKRNLSASCANCCSSRICAR